MAKTTAPALSFGASGAIADTMVYGSWRGVPYVRRHVIPANPRSQAQTLTRDIFRTMSQMWKQAPGMLSAPWDEFAKGRPFLGVNRFMGDNVRVLRADAMNETMAEFIGSPGARGGLPPSALVITPSTDALNVAVTTPTPPEGWTLTALQGVAFLDQNPIETFDQPILSEEDTVGAGELDFTGLEGGELYVVSVWLLWEKSNGDTAYSVSLTDTATPTA
jgi:hypothetical protein